MAKYSACRSNLQSLQKNAQRLITHSGGDWQLVYLGCTTVFGLELHVFACICLVVHVLACICQPSVVVFAPQDYSTVLGQKRKLGVESWERGAYLHFPVLLYWPYREGRRRKRRNGGRAVRRHEQTERSVYLIDRSDL